MTNHQPQVLIIGLGNTLRGDDALGRIAADRLKALVDPHRVRVVSQSAPTPELAASIADVSLVIFLDASTDGPDDRIVVRTLSAADVLNPLAHRLDAPSLLALAGHLYNHVPDALAVTFRGRTFELSDQQLSDEADSACDQIVREALRLIGKDVLQLSEPFAVEP